MLEYNLIGTNDYIVNPLETVLNNRGITDIERFLNVSKEDTHDYKLLTNIDKASDLIIDHLKKDSKVLLIVDSDCDGYTSSALMYNYLKRVDSKINLDFHIHKEKIHGVFDKDVVGDIDLVIVLDAGSYDFEEHEKLSDRGKTVVVGDHHTGEKYSKHATVVNNHLCDYPNKELSGVGIAYKICQAMDDKLGVNYADDYLDLVAVGLIADLMKLNSLETRYYVTEGLKPENIRNPLLVELIKKQEFVTKGIINVKTIGWNISPLINATIRVGKQEEKEDMFKAMLESYSDETMPYKKRGQEETIEQPLAEAMARICGNVKGRQDRARDKSLAILENVIEEEGLSNKNILMVNATGVLDKSLTGLVAMQLASKYKRPTLILHEHEDNDEEEMPMFHGSGRNFDYSPIGDFREFLDDLELFNYVSGHDGAFGYQILTENLDEVKNKSDILLKDVEFNEHYTVDFVIPAHKLTKQFIKTIADKKDIWGKGVEEPEIAVEDIVINTENIELVGKTLNTIKFTHGDIEFVKFRTNEEEYRKLVDGKTTLKLNIVGKCDTNFWAGKTISQIVMNDFACVNPEDFEDELLYF